MSASLLRHILPYSRRRRRWPLQYSLLPLAILSLTVANSLDHSNNQFDPFPGDILTPYPEGRHGGTRTTREISSCQHTRWENRTVETFKVLTTPPSGDGKLKFKMHKYADVVARTPLRKRYAVGTITFIEDPYYTLSVLEPSRKGTCHQNSYYTTKATVLDTAANYEHGCRLAANGGYFTVSNGNCLGNIVSDGRLVKSANGVQNANFGIKEDGSIVVGYIPEEELHNQTNPFRQLVTGVIWLVRNGTNYVNESKIMECSDHEDTGPMDTFVNVISARSAIGHDDKGRVVLARVEGQTHVRGANLYEFADVLIKRGVVNAINLDGGGSNTLVQDGILLNYPSDHCTIQFLHQSVVLPGDINIFFLLSRLLLLLSGDVELNPGPTVEEACKKVKEILRSHYATLEEATKGSLSSIMSHLYAKKIITKTVRDSQLLNYNKMIDEFEAKLSLLKDVSELKAHCQVFLECISQGGPTDVVARSLDSEWRELFDMESLVPAALSMISSTRSLSPVSNTALTCFLPVSNDLITASPPQQFSNVSAGGIHHDINIKPFENEEIEEKVYTSLDVLRRWFSKLAKNFKLIFREKNKHNSQLATDVSEWLTVHMKWEEGSVVNSLDDIFRKIQPYYDFIDCKLLLDMSNEFLQDATFTDDGVTCKLVDELHSHTLMSKRLCKSNTVSDLEKLLQEHYKHFDRNMDNLPCINIHLQTCWDDISIDGLYELIEKLLPQKHREPEYKQSIIKHIIIRNKCIVIKLYILDITADSLIEYTGGKLQFMRLIGIFSLYINDHPVLQENENMKFTFELVLLEAVTAGNNEAVEFLLQLETVNIDHTNEEGKTALMIACEKGHEDIVHSLLSAEANVNIQDNKGWTALMIASEHNHISIIHMLLQANANPHLKKSNGSNAVMIASGNGNDEVVELLISKGVDYKYQREDGWNAFMLACQNGHTQVVKLLLKKQVDPKVQRNNGGNAFMLACQFGHIQIVELLLKEKVDPNVQRNDEMNAFMLACHSGHSQIVELLMKEHS
uniref:Phosphodiester glycosidase domain-containing protein n=1 Tax=Amphimedon queenslandica TaxID=400682 RepID=A0A1X7TAB2_AMPQE